MCIDFSGKFPTCASIFCGSSQHVRLHVWGSFQPVNINVVFRGMSSIIFSNQSPNLSTFNISHDFLAKVPWIDFGGGKVHIFLRRRSSNPKCPPVFWGKSHMSIGILDSLGLFLTGTMFFGRKNPASASFFAGTCLSIFR